MGPQLHVKAIPSVSRVCPAALAMGQAARRAVGITLRARALLNPLQHPSEGMCGAGW